MPDPVSIIQSAIQITTTLPLTQYMSYFNTPTPIPGPTPEAFRDVSSYTFNFMGLFTQAAPWGAVTVQMVSGSVIQYYFGLRIAMMTLLFVVAFVATRLGLDVPTTPIVVFGRAGKMLDMNWNYKKLPKLPKLPKFAVALAIVSGVSIGMVALVYAASVTLVNPNFDSDVSGWYTNAWCDSFAWDASGYSGGGGLAFSSIADVCYITQSVSLASTTNYTLSFWSKCSFDDQIAYGFDYSNESYCSVSYSWHYCSSGFSDISAGSHFIYAGVLPGESCTFDSFTLVYPDQSTPTPTPTSTPTETPTPTTTPTPTNTPTPGPTPTGTPAPSSHTIELSSGERFSIDYRFSFGEIASVTILLMLLVVMALRWVYDFITARRD